MTNSDLPPPGRYPVGFSVDFFFDHTRTCHWPTEPEPSHGLRGFPRPVLCALWYPAKHSQGDTLMPYCGYFEFSERTIPQLRSDDAAAFASYAEVLAAHQSDTLCRMLFDAPARRVNSHQKSRFKELLATQTTVARDAMPCDESFPLVLYHSGLGGGYVENSILCEYLASHGYIVASSAYPRTDGASFSIDSDLPRSHADMGLLINALCNAASASDPHPRVQSRQLALVGHSFGAGAMLRYAILSDAIDAVVSLDSTLDYDVWLKDELYEEYLTARRCLALPLLVAAEMRAEFTVLKQLRYADRYLLRYAGLAHDDFLAQNLLRAGLNPSDETKAANVRACYGDLCCKVRLFLDAELKEDCKARSVLRQGRANSSTESLTYLSAHPLPPTMKQFAARAADSDVAGAIAWCRTQTSTERPLFEMQDLNMMGYDLIDEGRALDAVELFAYIVEVFPQRAMAWDSLAEAYISTNDEKAAVATYQHAIRVLASDTSMTSNEQKAYATQFEAAVANLTKSR
jgi:pimeloyl-ACP methyl ester carboxylesterase